MTFPTKNRGSRVRRLPAIRYLDQTVNPFFGLRERMGWSQAEFAVHSGISQACIAAYETGRILPSPPNAKKIQAALGRNGLAVTLDELYRHVRITHLMVQTQVPPEWPTQRVPRPEPA